MPLAMVLALAAVGLAQGQTPAAPTVSAGQNVAGTVTNLTTGQPLGNALVTLVQLQGSMQKVGSTTTDASGHYRFSQSTPGPFLVEVDYQSVPYFAQVTTGQSETNVQVYDAIHDANLVQVDAEIMVLQPDAGQLAVVNEYRVENGVQPPRTLTSAAGLFRFRVPTGASLDMVRVVGPGEMPLARAATPTAEHDVYSVASPLRPGETRIQVSYRVPYPALKAALAETPVIRPAHFEVYVPGAMTFTGAGFTKVGAQDGYTVYGIASGPVAATLQFQVAGDAPLPQAASSAAGAATDSGGTGAPAADGAAASSSATAAPAAATPAPTFLERNLWTVLAFLGLAAAAGFGMLLAQPEPVPLPTGLPVAPTVEMVEPQHTALPASPMGKISSALPAAPEALAQLRDDLFLLEVRQHTGNMPEAEYAKKRAEIHARMDKLAGK